MELPRHVHKPGGGRSDESKIVHDDADLEAALSEGWVIDPNAPIDAPPASSDPEPEPSAKRKPGRPPKQS